MRPDRSSDQSCPEETVGRASDRGPSAVGDSVPVYWYNNHHQPRLIIPLSSLIIYDSSSSIIILNGEARCATVITTVVCSGHLREARGAYEALEIWGQMPWPRREPRRGCRVMDGMGRFDG